MATQRTIESRERTSVEVKTIRLIFACAILSGSLIGQFVTTDNPSPKLEPLNVSIKVESTPVREQE